MGCVIFSSNPFSSQIIVSPWPEHPSLSIRVFNFGTRNSMRQKIRTRPNFGRAHWFLDLVLSNQTAPATGKMGFLHQNYIITLFFLFAHRQVFWTETCLFAVGPYLRFQAISNLLHYPYILASSLPKFHLWCAYGLGLKG